MKAQRRDRRITTAIIVGAVLLSQIVTMVYRNMTEIEASINIEVEAER